MEEIMNEEVPFTEDTSPFDGIKDHFPSYIIWTRKYHPRITGRKYYNLKPKNNAEWPAIPLNIIYDKHTYIIRCYNHSGDYYQMPAKDLQKLCDSNIIIPDDNVVTSYRKHFTITEKAKPVLVEEVKSM